MDNKFGKDKRFEEYTWAKRNLASAYKLEAFEQEKDKDDQPVWIYKEHKKGKFEAGAFVEIPGIGDTDSVVRGKLLNRINEDKWNVKLCSSSNSSGTVHGGQHQCLEKNLKLLYRIPKYKADETKSYTVVKQRTGGMQEDKIEKTPEVQTIDFIFHSKAHFKTVGTLSVPTFGEVEEETKEEYLPSWKYMSDHFMIGADLELITNDADDSEMTDSITLTSGIADQTFWMNHYQEDQDN